MKNTSWLTVTVSRGKKALYGLMLGSLLLAAACANGGYQTYQAPYSPNYGYYPDYYGPSYYPQQDPQYWQQWQDRSGAP